MSFVVGFISSFIPSIYKGYCDLHKRRKESDMSGHKMNYRQSQKIFTRNAVKQKSINTSVNVMRGGIRL